MAGVGILERYGIKEVADVTFYEIAKDSTGKETPGAPVLYLDTLKVSTTEQTAENTSARGGKGNPELIIWDYNKEITVTLEDALFSAKSLAVMFGSMRSEKPYVNESTEAIRRTVRVDQLTYTSAGPQLELNGNVFTISSGTYYDVNGAALTDSITTTATAAPTSAAYLTFDQAVKSRMEVEISANTFPGNYYVTGDTYARRESDGLDDFFQFIIPKAKVMSEVTLTLEAEGDPSTFSMNLRVLRPSDGKMMKLVKYQLDSGEDEG